MRTLMVGCGYVGFSLASELVRLGHEVLGMRRSDEGSAELIAAGIKPVVADVTNAESLQKIEGPFDWVINAVSSSKGGAEEYRQVYLQGTRNLVSWLGSMPLKKYVYTSSTSVYGQTDGSMVKETSATEPATETGKLLIETEQELVKAAADKKFPAVILRVAGIYGPQRGHLFQQFLKNEARLVGQGARLINMIHRDDVVGAIVAALKNGRPGEIYNTVDDEPVAEIHFYRWLCETLGKYMPPAATESEMAARKRGFTNKKVSNRRLKMELGYAFKYPTFRQGYTAEIKRLDQAGELDYAAEPR